jgi:hypothetical protein
MKKKATVLLALISMCLIGIGVVSAGGWASVGTQKPDGTWVTLKTYQDARSVMGTEADSGGLEVTVEYENGSIITEILEPSEEMNVLEPLEKIDPSARTIYYEAAARNNRLPGQCSIGSDNIDGYAQGKAWDMTYWCQRD